MEDTKNKLQISMTESLIFFKVSTKMYLLSKWFRKKTRRLIYCIHSTLMILEADSHLQIHFS